MTILLLILAIAAALAVCRMLFVLSVNALPVGTAVAAAFWRVGQGYDAVSALLVALMVGFGFANLGPWLCAQIRTSVIWLLLIFIFAAPAGIAGYAAAHAACLLLMPAGLASFVISLGTRCLIAGLAAERLCSRPRYVTAYQRH